MMDTTTRMRRKLAELNFDFSQFTMERFADYVGEFTGSEINFIGWDMPPGLFGAWVSLKDRASDYVFYDKNSPPILEIHTKLQTTYQTSLCRYVLCANTCICTVTYNRHTE